MSLIGERMKSLRDLRGESQAEFAAWLNGQLDKKYDKARVSRWEAGSEKMSEQLQGFIGDMLDRLEAERMKKFLVPTAPPAEPGTRRRGLTIALANQKGGVGKTASTVNLADILGHAGYRVLVVDCDPQANATTHLGVNAAALERDNLIRLESTGELFPRHLYAVLVKGVSFRDIIIPVAEGRIDLAPSGPRMHLAETDLVQMNYREQRLRKMIREVKADYDFILIDCNPAIGHLTINALTASDRLLIPCKTEPLSLMGLSLLLARLDDPVRDANPEIKVMGIIPTLFDKRTNEHKETLKDLEASYGRAFRVFTPVPRAIVYARASGAGMSVYAGQPDAAGMDAYGEIARAIVEEGRGRKADSAGASEVTHGR